MRVERRVSESVDLFRNAMEYKINRLTLANRRLKQKIFDLYTIIELSRKLNSVLDLEVLLAQMLSSLVDQLGTRSIAIFLRRDPKQDKLTLFKFIGGTRPQSSTKRDQPQLSLGGKLCRLFFSKKEPLLLEEIQSLVKVDIPEIRILQNLECKLCLPLISREELVGILILGPKKTNRRFTDGDLEFISVLTDLLTVAVENAILYENQKKINAKLKRTQRQLIQSEKLAALGQLSASLAHEINNPLGIIKNYILILSESLNQDDLNHHNLMMIKEEVDRIARIVKSLLDFSRPEKNKVALLNLSSIVKQTIMLIEKEFLTKNIRIKTHLPEDLCQVMGWEDQLKQVFLNLLVNSKDFMPQGGEITISARNTDQGVEIEFADTGPGIPDENICRIFEPFFTTKQEGKGTGLGLWICYGIMQKHGGTIRAKRKKTGTSFVLTWPKAQG